MKGSKVQRFKSSKLKKLWIGIGLLILLAPLGLILPALFSSGGAWGEWGMDEIKRIAGYVPRGFKELSEFWKAPIPEYTFVGWGAGVKSYLGYIISGVIGVALVVGISVLIGRLLARKNGNS